jgi:hypothetical protein
MGRWSGRDCIPTRSEWNEKEQMGNGVADA